VIDRMEATVLLLRSLNDLRLEPVTWSAQLRRQAVAGEGPSERVECASCCGEGTVRVRGIAVPCSAEGCGGRGWLFVDSYTRRPIGTAESGTSRATRAVRCDSCGGGGAFGNGRRCGYCGGGGWLELPLERLRAVRVGSGGSMLEWAPSLMVSALDEGFAGLGQAYRQRLQAGSYEELGAALESLRSANRGRHLLVWRVYVLGEREPESLPDLWRCRLHLGVEFLASEMPVVVRVPGWAARNERRRRERLRRPAGMAA
jgi:hypothetical protein